MNHLMGWANVGYLIFLLINFNVLVFRGEKIQNTLILVYLLNIKADYAVSRKAIDLRLGKAGARILLEPTSNPIMPESILNTMAMILQKRYKNVNVYYFLFCTFFVSFCYA